MTQILGSKRFAILLTYFTDSMSSRPFTKASVQSAWDGIGDFWKYDSYDKVNLYGSQIFDWQQYPSTNAAFTSAFTSTKNGQTKIDRGGMIEAVKTASGVDKSKFDYFIVIFQSQVGTAWTSGSGAIFEPAIVTSYYMCHEMTHMMGEPDHSYDFTGRVLQGPGEYWDQTDMMSAGNCWFTPRVVGDPFSGTGPHHCMFWKDKFGWLDETTIERIASTRFGDPFDETYTVYSRNEPVAERLNCVQFLDLWVEVAVNTDRGANVFFDRFDTGLPDSGVLIHERGFVGSNPVPYVLVPDQTNAPDQKFWHAGDVCSRIENAPDPGVDINVWIQSINLTDGSAQVNISNTQPAPLTRHQIVAIRKGHSTAGGGAGYDYISEVGIKNGAGETVALNRTDVRTWIENGRNTFYVLGGDGSSADVMVEGHYIKTVPDDDLEDNLLSLPAF